MNYDFPKFGFTMALPTERYKVLWLICLLVITAELSQWLNVMYGQNTSSVMPFIFVSAILACPIVSLAYCAGNFCPICPVFKCSPSTFPMPMVLSTLTPTWVARACTLLRLCNPGAFARAMVSPLPVAVIKVPSNRERCAADFTIERNSSLFSPVSVLASAAAILSMNIGGANKKRCFAIETGKRNLRLDVSHVVPPVVRSPEYVRALVRKPALSTGDQPVQAHLYFTTLLPLRERINSAFSKAHKCPSADKTNHRQCPEMGSKSIGIMTYGGVMPDETRINEQ